MATVGQHRFPAAVVELFDWLDARRRDGGLHHDEASGTWHAFRHADVAAIYADPETFSSDPRELAPASPVLERFAGGNIVRMDGPRHAHLRRLVTRAFTPRRVAALAPRIAAVADQLLDALPAQVDGDGVVDLVAGFTYPLPIIVIAEMLGVPGDDREQFRAWADVMLSSSLRADEAVLSADAIDRVAPAMAAMHDYFREQVARRRRAPAEDLLTALIAAEVDDERLGDDDIATFAVVLLLAGHVTTTVLLGSSLLCLDAHPAARAEVIATPGLIPAALEESMRYQPPFPRNLRRTTRDVEMGGQAVPAGSALSVWLAAANRDPDVFADADRFDLHRSPNPHLSFGLGAHFCLGAGLARLESRLALKALLGRHRDLELDGVPGHYPSVSMMVGPTRLPVRAAGLR